MDIRKEYLEFMNTEKMTKSKLHKGMEIISLCNEIYYNSGEESPLTDEEFDKLFRIVSKYEKVTTLTSPSSKRIVNISHEYEELVGTLEKANAVYLKDKTDEEQNSVEEWLSKIYKTTKFKDLSLLITLKYDGNSVCLILEKGVVTSALTRGKDGKGVDVTNIFKGIKFPINIDCGIKTEIMITDNNFQSMIDDTGNDYKKPRSVVAGILSKKDGYKFKDYLTVVPLRVQTKKGITREEELNILNKFKRTDIEFPTYRINGSYKDLLTKIQSLYEEISHKRSSMNFAIDGLVIEIMDEDIRKKLGREKDKNKYDIALKFPPLTGITKVKDIEFYSSTSATGRITPVLVFDDLIFDGATCNHVSLSNYKRFKELNLAKGDEVIIDYRNDCLSYCTGVSKRNGEKPIKFISKCPLCGEKLYVNKNRTFVYCKNNECIGKIKGKVQNWIEKLGVKGIKENTLASLIDSGIIKNITDLYKITKEDILTIKGYKEKSAQNIIDAINSKTKIYDWELLGSLNINLFSRSRAKEVCKKYTIDELLNMDITKISNIEGFADKTVISIKNGLEENKELIKELMNILTIVRYKDELSKNSNGKTYTIVFTGFRDGELQQQLELLGHKVTGSVSKNTDIVVTKDVNGSSSKLKTARDLGKIIVDKEGLLKIINK